MLIKNNVSSKNKQINKQINGINISRHSSIVSNKYGGFSYQLWRLFLVYTHTSTDSYYTSTACILFIRKQGLLFGTSLKLVLYTDVDNKI